MADVHLSSIALCDVSTAAKLHPGSFETVMVGRAASVQFLCYCLSMAGRDAG